MYVDRFNYEADKTCTGFTISTIIITLKYVREQKLTFPKHSKICKKYKNFKTTNRLEQIWLT